MPQFQTIDQSNQQQNKPPTPAPQSSKFSRLRTMSPFTHNNIFIDPNATLNEGGEARVVLGIDSESKRRVAVKIYPPFFDDLSFNSNPSLWRKKADLEKEAQRQRLHLLLEVQTMRHLDNEHIIRVQDAFERRGFVFVILEFVQTDLLEHLLSSRSLGEVEAGELFAQLLDAVDALHSIDIAHNDLKLENILFDSRRRRVVLTDFGASFFESQKPKTTPEALLPFRKDLSGTPSYVAPEVVLRDSLPHGYDAYKADVYSLGVILCCLTLGRLPFKDQDGLRYYTPSDLLMTQPHRPDLKDFSFVSPTSQQRHQQTHASKEFIDLMHKMLHPNPCLRASLDEVVQHPWVMNFTQKFQNVSNCREATVRAPIIPQTSMSRAAVCE